MFVWKRWILPGLAVVVLLTATAAMLRQGAVEADLSTRALQALQADHPWAGIEVAGRDLALTGSAPSEASIREAIESLREIRGVRTAISRVELLPLQSPYRLDIGLSDGTLTMEGYVPDEATHRAIASLVAATVPDATVDDRLRLARGAPDNFLPLVGYAVAQLAGLKQGSIEFDDNRLSVRGKALSPAAYENILDALDAIMPGAEIASLEVEPPVVSPYVWSLSRQGNEMMLAGHAPTLAKRITIAADIRKALPDIRLDNRLSIASGLSDTIDWTAATSFLAGQLAHLANGTININDGLVTVKGEAASPEAFEALATTLNRELPAGLSLDSASIDRPVVSPFTWSFELDKANAVVLAGYVPDTIVADRLSKAARTHAGSGQLHDSQHLASGAPEGFEAAALAALGAADRLTDMRASISDKTLAIEGETFTGIAANELRTKLSGELPPDFTLETRIVVRPPAEIIAPAECQADLGESLRQSSIRFETGSAGISTNSLGLLDRLAFTLRSCPEVRFEVGGHTDSEGTEEDNLDLSTARAQAVVDRLIRAGVRYSRLVAKGYGESRPVADNATQEGRARNRRIEFRIIQ